MHKRAWFVVNCLAVLSLFACGHVLAQPNESTHADLLDRAINNLVRLQDADGAWPYEGVYRVGGEIPVGYRVGGTAIVCDALLHAPTAPSESVDTAIRRGIELMLLELEDSRMQPTTKDAYDVRVWGHIYALNLFCQITEYQRFEVLREQTDPWIAKLTAALVEEEIEGGGWNYANQKHHAAFVTAPAVQALLAARKFGQEIPEEIFERSAKILLNSRSENGAIQYSGTVGNGREAKLPGSIARSPICEATLIMLDKGNTGDLKDAIDAFHEHWDELEKRRKKTGTHTPPYGVAPYYFYYGHRYLAQSIAFLPQTQQAAEYERFSAVLLKTKDDDDTWNDRIFDRSKAFGTAMAVLALSSGSAPQTRMDEN